MACKAEQIRSGSLKKMVLKNAQVPLKIKTEENKDYIAIKLLYNQ